MGCYHPLCIQPGLFAAVQPLKQLFEMMGIPRIEHACD
ncbi:hypothetical protein ASZ90_015762 [hydrocarbon metagenome]|uniref:Uncharacterized protein n=1 Tax=hydrocarbon metagenome TaxID=938273 RepID=A0A0W8F1Y3_9ZZZZ